MLCSCVLNEMLSEIHQEHLLPAKHILTWLLKAHPACLLLLSLCCGSSTGGSCKNSHSSIITSFRLHPASPPCSSFPIEYNNLRTSLLIPSSSDGGTAAFISQSAPGAAAPTAAAAVAGAFVLCKVLHSNNELKNIIGDGTQ